MKILSESEGPMHIDNYELSGEARSEIGHYWNAVQDYRANGATEKLYQMQGTVINGQRLETSTDIIDFYANQGKLEFEDIYEEG